MKVANKELEPGLCDVFQKICGAVLDALTPNMVSETFPQLENCDEHLRNPDCMDGAPAPNLHFQRCMTSTGLKGTCPSSSLSRSPHPRPKDVCTRGSWIPGRRFVDMRRVNPLRHVAQCRDNCVSCINCSGAANRGHLLGHSPRKLLASSMWSSL